MFSIKLTIRVYIYLPVLPCVWSYNPANLEASEMNPFPLSHWSLGTAALADYSCRELVDQELDPVNVWYAQDIVVVVVDMRVGLYKMEVAEIDCF